MKFLGGFVVTFAALVGIPAWAQEPGQTPRPTVTEPVREPTEEEQVRLDKALPEWESVKDDAPFVYSSKVQMDAVKMRRALDEERAYNYTLIHAHRQPVERLRQFSAKNVPVANLYHDIHVDYLRELVHVEGRLALVTAMKATEDLPSVGIKELYECWVFPNGMTHPVCVVVSELPEGITPGENQTARVAFDAYYFKLWHYETRKPKDPAKDPDKKQWEKAPLFLGKTFDVRGTTTEEAASAPGVLYGVAAALVVLVGIGVAITWYFRRGDRQIRAAARQKIDSLTTFEDSPEPAAGPVNRIADQFE